jgi:uncharacterized membrane protein
VGIGPERGRNLDRAALGLVGAGVLSALISAYLTVTHYAGGTLACVNAGFVDCDAVTTSSYSLVPFTEIPIALVGVLWSAASVAGGVLALRSDPAWLRPAHLAWAGAALAFALYLINAEIAVIGRICEWCTALHVLIAATFFLALSRMR